MRAASIILPAFNAQNYISQAIESAQAQTEENIEIICVDDGSTDATAQVIKDYAAKDDRIVLVSKQNGGISSARNAGLKQAQGDYIFFLDADDELASNAVSRVLECVADCAADFVKFSAEAQPREYSSEWFDWVLSLEDKSFESFNPQLIFHEKIGPFVWNSAFRREFLTEHSLRFDERLTLGEDQVFVLLAATYAQKTIFLSDVLYSYRVFREGSLMNTVAKSGEKRLMQHQMIFEVLLETWKPLGLADKEAIRFFNFMAEFLLPDICNIDNAYMKDRVLVSLSELLHHWFNLEEIIDGSQNASMEYVLTRAYTYHGNVKDFGKLYHARLFCGLHGRRACIKKLLRG